MIGDRQPGDDIAFGSLLRAENMKPDMMRGNVNARRTGCSRAEVFHEFMKVRPRNSVGGASQVAVVSSAVVVELDAPAPLAAVVGVPPGLEDADLAAREEDGCADVGRRGPVILASDAPGFPCETRHGAVRAVET